MTTKIAVLLPTYNGEKYIKQQVVSILNQTYQNIELLVRDDNSLDATKNILKELALQDSRIQFFEDDLGNIGLVKGVELLLSKTECEWVMFADQDDVWLVNKIEEFYKVAVKCESDLPVLIHSDALVTNEELVGNSRFLGSAPLKKGLVNSFFLFSVQGCSMMINKALKDRLFPFPSEAYLHDRYIHLVVELIGRRIYINKPLMLYRQHGGNVVGRSNLRKKIKNFIFNKQKYYIPVDKDLVIKIFALYAPEHELFDYYKSITGADMSRFDKFILIRKLGIAMRLKEKLLLLLKN